MVATPMYFGIVLKRVSIKNEDFDMRDIRGAYVAARLHIGETGA